MTEEHGASPSAISKGRLEFLYDGIFAIAMTILVLELKVPELNDRHSIGELAHALAHHGPTFASYLLSFLMLGIFWSRHNQDYRHFHRITYPMLVMTLVQLAAAAFFPFCAAMLGRYPQNRLAYVVYVGCVLVLMWARLATWVVAKRSGTFGADFPLTDYLRTRNRILRGCLVLLAMFALAYMRVLES
jgi:uncharacterized membrane protein